MTRKGIEMPYCYCLFVSLDCSTGDVEHPVTFLFDTEERAEVDSIELLIDWGLATRTENGIVLTDFEDETAHSDWQALEAFQSGLGPTEYFHIYDCIDRRILHKPSLQLNNN